MLKVFKGPKGEEAYIAFCAKFQKENPLASVISLDAESLEFETQLGELVASRDLFGSGVLCHGRRILASTKLKEGDLEKSATTFAFLEPEDRPKGKSKYKSDGPNLFALADKLVDKDKRGLWVEYQRARLAGVEPKDVYFKLQWQTRCMLAARVSKNAKEAGLSDYPYNKSKSVERRFGPGELEGISNRLIAIWHEGHGGGQDMELALEQFILSM